MWVNFKKISDTQLPTKGAAYFYPFAYIDQGILCTSVGVSDDNKLPALVGPVVSYQLRPNSSNESYIGFRSVGGKPQGIIRISTDGGPGVRVILTSSGQAITRDFITGTIGFYFHHNSATYAVWTSDAGAGSNDAVPEYVGQATMNWLLSLRTLATNTYLQDQIHGLKSYVDNEITSATSKFEGEITTLKTTVDEEIASLTSDLGSFSGRFTVL